MYRTTVSQQPRDLRHVRVTEPMCKIAALFCGLIVAHGLSQKAKADITGALDVVFSKAGSPIYVKKASPEKALNWRLRRTETVSPVGVVHEMGLVVLNTPLEKVKSFTCLPSSSTTACNTVLGQSALMPPGLSRDDHPQKVRVILVMLGD